MSDGAQQGRHRRRDRRREVPRRLPRMAKGINEMVNGHIAVKKKAMACIAEFGKGNFEAALEKFPGKKAFINDTIEQVRTNLKNVASDGITLSEAADKGELDTRADEQKYAGAWRQIIQGMNKTLEGFATPMRDIGAGPASAGKKGLFARRRERVPRRLRRAWRQREPGRGVDPGSCRADQRERQPVRRGLAGDRREFADAGLRLAGAKLQRAAGHRVDRGAQPLGPGREGQCPRGRQGLQGDQPVGRARRPGREEVGRGHGADYAPARSRSPRSSR